MFNGKYFLCAVAVMLVLTQTVYGQISQHIHFWGHDVNSLDAAVSEEKMRQWLYIVDGVEDFDAGKFSDFLSLVIRDEGAPVRPQRTVTRRPITRPRPNSSPTPTPSPTPIPSPTPTPTPENFTPALCGTYTLNADGYLNHDNETTPFIPTGDQLLLLQAGDSFIVDGGIITEVQLRGLKENHVYQLHSLLTRDMHMIGDVTAILPDSNITENWIFTIVDGAHLTLTRPTGISQHVKEINFTGDAGTLTLVSNALTLDIEASEDTSFVLRAGGTGIPFFTNPQVQIDGFIITQLSNDLSLTITDNYIMIDGNAHTQGTPDRNCLLNGVNC